MMLPIILLSMIRIVNNKKIMEAHVNNGFQNAVGWTSTVVLLGLTAIMLVTQLIQSLAGK